MLLVPRKHARKKRINQTTQCNALARERLSGAQRADAVVVGGYQRRPAVEAQLPALRPAVVPHPARPPTLVLACKQGTRGNCVRQ